MIYPHLNKDELADLAAEMKANAKASVITDYDAFAIACQAPEEGVVHSQAGDLIHSCGNRLPKVIEPYTRFFTLDSNNNLQVTYFEIQLPDRRLAHLNIINKLFMFPFTIDPDQAVMVTEQFLDIGVKMAKMPTPPHVLLLLQEIAHEPQKG